AVTNVSITEVVVPNQAAAFGVTISNSARIYSFSPGGGSIAGTAAIVKRGTNNLVFNAAEAGPISITAGSLDCAGFLGAATISSNVVVNLNIGGSINGGLTSTGIVTVANGAAISGGGLFIRGGKFINSGFVSTVVASGAAVVSGGSLVTNTALGEIDVDTGGNGNNYVVTGGSTVANFGIIKHIRGRMN